MKQIQPQKFIRVIKKIGNSTWTLRVPVVAIHLASAPVTAAVAEMKFAVVHVLPYAGMLL
jgi:hypothetical protein